MLIIFGGLPGTGKTTISKELQKRGFRAISIDETENLCSWVHQETGKKSSKEVELNPEFVNEHDWICDVELLKKLMDKGTDVVFVLGRAGNQDDFLHLFDKIILLQCSPETFCKRIEERTDNDFGKHLEIRKQILGRYKAYAEKMLAKDAISIDTERPVDEVVRKILELTFLQ